MWFRYKGSLLNCPSNKYSDFIFRQYLKNTNNRVDLTKNKEKQTFYSLILERAEKRYLNEEIFKAV
jgi:hypothetical protein